MERSNGGGDEGRRQKRSLSGSSHIARAHRLAAQWSNQPQDFFYLTRSERKKSFRWRPALPYRMHSKTCGNLNTPQALLLFCNSEQTREAAKRGKCEPTSDSKIGSVLTPSGPIRPSGGCVVQDVYF